MYITGGRHGLLLQACKLLSPAAIPAPRFAHRTIYKKRGSSCEYRFRTYFQQEVDEIKNRFVKEEEDRRGWQLLVFKAVANSNPLIPNLNQIKNNFIKISSLKMVILGLVMLCLCRYKYVICCT